MYLFSILLPLFHNLIFLNAWYLSDIQRNPTSLSFFSLIHSEVYVIFKKLYIVASNAPRSLFLLLAHEKWHWLEKPDLVCCMCLYMVKEYCRAPKCHCQLPKAARSPGAAAVLLTATETLKLALFHSSFLPFNSTETQLFHSCIC